MAGLCVCGAILFEGVSTSMALAAVAVLGYLVGLWRRDAEAARIQRELNDRLQLALANSRQLEQITDGVLQATREALRQSSQLREASQAQPAPHVADEFTGTGKRGPR